MLSNKKFNIIKKFFIYTKSKKFKFKKKLSNKNFNIIMSFICLEIKKMNSKKVLFI
jgi:hypothetical protein